MVVVLSKGYLQHIENSSAILALLLRIESGTFRLYVHDLHVRNTKQRVTIRIYH